MNDIGRALIAWMLVVVASAAAQKDGPGLDGVMAGLIGDEPETALEALVKLDTAETTPKLVAMVREGEATAAWRAMRGLRAMGASVRSSDKPLSAAVEELVVIAGAKESPATSRVCACLALEALASRNKKSAESLDVLVARQADPALRLAAALALSGSRKYGVNALDDTLPTSAPAPAILRMAAIAMMGKDGKGAKKTLKKIIGDTESLPAFFRANTARFALEQVAGERAAAAAWEKRLKKTKGKHFVGGRGGINVGGLVPPDPLMFVSLAEQELRVPVKRPLDLPPTLKKEGGGLLTVLDGAAQFSDHVARALVELAGDVRKGDISSQKAWDERTKALANTWAFVEALLEKTAR